MLSAPVASSSSGSTSPAFLQSPNAIPPRRSSTGQQHHQHQHSASLPQPSSSASASASASAPTSTSTSHQRHHHSSSSSSTGAGKSASVLRSVPEADWLHNPGTRRPRKPSITMASLKASAAAAGNPILGTGSTGSTDRPTPSTSSASVLEPTKHQPLVPPTSKPFAGAASGSSSSVATSVLTATALQPTPPPDPRRYASEDFNFSARRTWTDEKERIVCGPFDYLNSTRGKEFRTQLINAFNGWLEVPADSLEIITRIVGMLHTASLLVDDVEDSSSLRRGLPVAHNIFGVPQTINSANYIYFVALQEVQKLRNPKALAVFSEELCNLHRGQGMDLFWRDTLTCPTEDDYLEMVGHKTGGLFRLGIKLMQAESRSLVDCVPLVNLLGLLFQIQDDYRNLMASEYSQNKGMCEDLTEGKFSFPVIHSIRANPSNLQLLNILKQRTTDEEVKRYAVAHMESTGSFAYTKEVLQVLTERARTLADELDEGKGRSQAVHVILDHLAIN
ncbi:geranylgeranyl diphosphate synthase, type III [Sporothrix schenckii 1099-18]|uniref:Geranylgeranyl diphosphate synthase, type III n=1 Tax=Sporothrix schenckii 1099-18 TaxID=1397361 RepID=A0A0F2LSN8_SPOSC|nr:geranylgeranyl diphosphate synthase, type III [Sporothrix schenckii 1099-18]KJR80498.1 geranylgeranyl diphosphate synthase, type III [Sporothrix schenckii 1099-18]